MNNGIKRILAGIGVNQVDIDALTEAAVGNIEISCSSVYTDYYLHDKQGYLGKLNYFAQLIAVREPARAN